MQNEAFFFFSRMKLFIRCRAGQGSHSKRKQRVIWGQDIVFWAKGLVSILQTASPSSGWGWRECEV